MTEAMATSRSRPHRRPCLSMRVAGSPAWRLPSLKPLRPRRLLACIGAPRLGHSPAAEVRPEEPPAIWPPQERSPFPGRSASPVPTMFTIGWEQHREWQGSALYWVDIMSGAAQWEQPRMVPAAILTPAWSQCRRVGNPRTWYTQTRARLGRPALATWRRPALRPATPLREIAVRASQGSPSPYPAHTTVVMVGLAADAAQLILGAGQLSQRWSIRWLFPTLPERKLRWLPAPGRTQLVLLLTAARRRWLDI